ncbi:MAG TPA: DUF2946 family protein [Acidobacteriaceae bacterium]|nr:DUF2946 family protein [Acidobacteriaceae bacterium]
MIWRKPIAALLLLVFVLPMLLSSMAMGQDPESGLPACCRRNGQHHCAMTLMERSAMAMSAATQQEPRWSSPAEHCPYCPASVTVAQHLDSLAPPPVSPLLLYSRTLAERRRQAECRRRIALDGARHKRGPPASSLA